MEVGWLEVGKGNVLSIKSIIVTLVALAILAVPISNATAKDTYLTYDELRRFEEKKAEQQWSNQLVAYSTTLVGKRTGQCVTSLRKYFGISRNEVQGLAKSTKPNSKTPTVGSIIILKMSSVGHVGIVIRVDGDLVTYFDSNGSWTQRGAIRTILINDRRIAGYRIVK